MSPASIGYWHMEGGQLVLRFANPTVHDFNQYPELAIDVLVCTIFTRSVEISPPGEYGVPPHHLLQVLWDWLYCAQPLDGMAAIEPSNLWNRTVALTHIRKRGRPIESRHTAVKALFRREYLKKSWADVTRFLCQCGEAHDDKQKFKKCQDNIESQVRILRKVLRKCDIAFPPKPAKDDPPTRRKPELSRSKPEGKEIPTLEESSGALRKTSQFAIPHPAIAILLDGSPLPITNCDPDPSAGSAALSLFNPWDRGWIPMWFPTLLGTEAPSSKEEYQRLRYNCFDRIFKRFAGSDWPPKGSLDSQREAIARTLQDIYRAVMAERWVEIDDLKPTQV
jgi:hypothetical protein